MARKAKSRVSSRCRIEKEEKEREHKPEGTRGCTRPEVFGKDAMKKGDRNHPNSMQHGNYRIENLKISENMIRAQVQSGATAHQAMQPSRAERQLYDSCEQKPVGSPKFWLNGSSQRALGLGSSRVSSYAFMHKTSQLNNITLKEQDELGVSTISCRPRAGRL